MNTQNWRVRAAYYEQRGRDLNEIIAKSTDQKAVRNAKRCLTRWVREDAFEAKSTQ